MVTPQKGNSARLGGHAHPGVPSVSAPGVSNIDSENEIGVRVTLSVRAWGFGRGVCQRWNRGIDFAYFDGAVSRLTARRSAGWEGRSTRYHGAQRTAPLRTERRVGRAKLLHPVLGRCSSRVVTTGAATGVATTSSGSLDRRDLIDVGDASRKAAYNARICRYADG
jgi:hypothetical protein